MEYLKGTGHQDVWERDYNNRTDWHQFEAACENGSKRLVILGVQSLADNVEEVVRFACWI